MANKLTAAMLHRMVHNPSSLGKVSFMNGIPVTRQPQSQVSSDMKLNMRDDMALMCKSKYGKQSNPSPIRTKRAKSIIHKYITHQA